MPRHVSTEQTACRACVQPAFWPALPLLLHSFACETLQWSTADRLDQHGLQSWRVSVLRVWGNWATHHATSPFCTADPTQGGRGRFQSHSSIASVGHSHERNGSGNSIAETWEHQGCALSSRDLCGWNIVLRLSCPRVLR